MNNILLPTDGSEYSFKAAKYACKLLKNIPESQLTIVHVGNVPKELLTHGYMLEMNIDPSLVKKLMEEKTDQVIERTKEIFDQEGIVVDTLLQIGNPVEVICQLVEDNKYDLVILGSRGLGELKGLLLGSVSDRISHMAKCPVLIVK